MPDGLRRYQQQGHNHFLTFSCYRRQPHLDTPAARDLCEEALERTRDRYGFSLFAYVIMPNHVHLLVSELPNGGVAKAIQALKLSVARRSEQVPFWQARYYDFNVYTEKKWVEKVVYIHCNPVSRGLVQTPGEWRWSSYNTFQALRSGAVLVYSFPRAGENIGAQPTTPLVPARIVEADASPTSQKRDAGHPDL